MFSYLQNIFPTFSVTIMIEDFADIILSLMDFQNKIDIELSDTAVQPLDVIYWLKQTSQIYVTYNCVYVTYDCVYENIKNIFLISDSGFETRVGLRKLLLDLGKIQCQEKIFEKNFEIFCI